MTEKTESLLQQYQAKGILVDTNILLLLFVGSTNRERITKFKRTERFTPQDYDRLIHFLQNFTVIATTPNILTEVNSLINQLGEPDRSRCYKTFANAVESFEEAYVASKSIISLGWPFFQYGLTDCGIAQLAQSKYLVLTDDLKATSYLNYQGVDTINFNNLRPLPKR